MRPITPELPSYLAFGLLIDKFEEKKNPHTLMVAIHLLQSIVQKQNQLGDFSYRPLINKVKEIANNNKISIDLTLITSLTEQPASEIICPIPRKIHK